MECSSDIYNIVEDSGLGQYKDSSESGKKMHHDPQ